MTVAVRMGRSDASRIAPAEYRDAVELFARQYGGHGDVIWIPNPGNVWQARLELAPNDPRRKAQEFESVLLHRFVSPQGREWNDPKVRDRLRKDRFNRPVPGYVSYELDEIGVERLTDFLERGSLLSGRGEFTSAEDALRVVMQQNAQVSGTRFKDAKDQAMQRSEAYRRSLLKIPYLPVGIDLQQRSNT